MNASKSARPNIPARILRFLGSISLGVAIMTLLAVAMGWATFLEREMGTPVAQYLVYASKWFYVLIAVLALNLVCAALLRIPALLIRIPDPDGSGKGALKFNSRLLPFFLAHVGTVLLILGCWITAEKSVRARASIPEGSATETAIDVDSRIFSVAIEEFGKDATDAPDEIVAPFQGGPLNWRDQERRELWKANVAAPILAAKPEGSFVRDLVKGCAKLSQSCAYLAAKSARRGMKPLVCDQDGVRIEVLEYAPLADYAPARDLVIDAKRATEDGSVKSEKIALSFPFDAASVGGDPLATSRRAQRLELSDGARVVYILADSCAEANAFMTLQPTPEEGTDVLVLVVDGERHVVKLEDLGALSRYGDVESQFESLSVQRGEIERRLNLETARPEGERSEKPLQTVSQEALADQTTELREAGKKLSELEEDAFTEDGRPGKAYDEYLRVGSEFSRLRTLNYLSATWAQLESVSASSAEFIDALQKMLDSTSERLKELESVKEATALGSSGWRIAAFETTPTLLSGVEALQGWTARLALTDPQGGRHEAQLQSELFERNRYPESGRVFGAIWIKDKSGDDNEYGRPWSKALDKPKLEIMQSRNGAVFCRYSDGKGVITSRELTVEPLKDEEEAYRTAEVQFGKGVPGGFESFAIAAFSYQDELGARILPTLFQKDMASEFYGKAKVRATFDGIEETFWLRTIPLESVTEQQQRALTKRFASPKRAVTIALKDKEINLGSALFIKRFSPVYEPGSSTAASFESLARPLPAGMTPEEQADAVVKDTENDVLIRMNRPGVLRDLESGKTYWAYQDSFRGPFKPGDPEFDSAVKGKLLPGETVPRETIYHTTITFNDDPGRGIKYLACLLVVLGTAMLVYRKSGSKRAKDAETNSSSVEEKSDEDKNGSGAAKTVATAVLMIAAALGALFSNTKNARADEVVPPEELPRAAKTSANVDWTPWQLVPVFDGGRIQPLNTYAEILIRDLTGSAKPALKVSASLLETLENGKPLNFPNKEEFLREFEQDPQNNSASNDDREKWYDEAAAATVKRQEECAARIRALFNIKEKANAKTRKFAAAELLFAMLAEPEVWEYVPFLDDPGALVAENVLKLSDEEREQRAGRLAPADLDAPAGASGKTMVQVYRESAKPDEKTIAALDKLETRVASFRSVTFAPVQGASAQTRTRLNRILFGAAPQHMGFHPAAATGPMTKLDESCANLERLLLREKRALRKSSPFNDKEFALRKRVEAEGNARGREPLALARQISLLSNLYGRYPVATSGALFEQLLGSVEKTLSEMREHRDKVIADQEFSVEYRNELLRAVGTLEEIVDGLESAFLSLTTEEPKSLRVLPLTRARVFNASEAQESPWASLQTVLWASDEAYARFVRPQDKKADDTVDPSEIIARAYRLSPFDLTVESLKKSLDHCTGERRPAKAFLKAVEAWRSESAEFGGSLKDFAEALREEAEGAEPFRAALAEKTGADPAKSAEILRKTAYPTSGRPAKSLRAELFYYRLDPFFWNWVTGAISVAALILAQISGFIGKKVAERRCFWIGSAFLFCSCAVAFLGGAVRAYITGWAPVANMFETVVLLAFLIAAIALGRTFAPFWSQPFGRAWRSAGYRRREDVAVGGPGRGILLLLRSGLALWFFVIGLRLWSNGRGFDAEFWASAKRAAANALAMQGVLDSITALAVFLLVVWCVPRFVAALCALVFFPRAMTRRAEGDESDATSETVERKTFLTAGALIATLVAAAAYFNSAEFNPHIRPLVAVLRSNFWLTIHVIAIIVSYALGAIAWMISLSSLGSYIFGKYDVADDGGVLVREPSGARRSAGIIATMTRSAVLFLTAGIILGARWADFSWGRFWSWDPKEVWALATLLVYLAVLHAYRLSGRKRFILTLGATIGALAIIMTWYGLSFVMGGGGRHAYAAGETNKAAALWILFAVNIGWSALAIARFWLEKAKGLTTAPGIVPEQSSVPFSSAAASARKAQKPAKSRKRGKKN